MSDRSEILTITIRPAQEHELDLLEAQFSPQSLSRNHHQRYAVQANDDGVYLIAWSGDTPVGHLLLIWEGPAEDVARGYPPNTAYLQAGGTREAYRRQGVMTRLISEAERLASERGYDTLSR
jgi:GNAT superfamily N-acetyltransferase